MKAADSHGYNRHYDCARFLNLVLVRVFTPEVLKTSESDSADASPVSLLPLPTCAGGDTLLPPFSSLAPFGGWLPYCPAGYEIARPDYEFKSELNRFDMHRQSTAYPSPIICRT